jgi:hypothetical protein
MPATRRIALPIGSAVLTLLLILIQAGHVQGRLLAPGGPHSDRGPDVAAGSVLASPCATSEAVARPGDDVTSNGLVLSLTAGDFRIGAETVEVNARTTDGNPVSGAVVVVTIRMPAMDHGVSAYPAREIADGRYRAHDVSLGMAGDWEITVQVIRQGRTPAEAAFLVPVGGR